MRTYEAVLFDYGGIFTDSPFAAAKALGAEYGLGYEETTRLVFGPYDEDTDHPWHQLERGEMELEQARSSIRSLSEEASGLALDPVDVLTRLGNGGIREFMIDKVKAVRAAGYKTALVTNNAREFRALWEPTLPLEELFVEVVDSSEVGFRKPDPRIFELTLERLGVEPARAVFLDDYHGNVFAAEKLGITGVLVGHEIADAHDAVAELDEVLAGRYRR